MDRKLSLQRVRALEAGPLARYLAPFLTQAAPSLTRDSYLKTVLDSFTDDQARSVAVRLAVADLRSALIIEGTEPADPDVEATVIRRAAALREALYRSGGIHEQDLSEPQGVAPAIAPSGIVTAPGGAVLSVVIWIPHLRSPFNVGNIIRTAAGFGVAGVVLGEAVPELTHPRLRRAAMGATEMVPIVRGGRDEAAQLLGGLHPKTVALETGGTDITRFSFPHAGIMAVGHEELGVPEEILRECYQDDTVVTIPHDGAKSSLNVGVAAGICLSWWQARGATD